LARKDLETAQRDLEDLFDVTAFGTQGEWKKLNKLCLSKDTGECVVLIFNCFIVLISGSYTYEVCLFDEARQKPNKGGATFSLG
jgi:protein kinase C substrate 80K-H